MKLISEKLERNNEMIVDGRFDAESRAHRKRGGENLKERQTERAGSKSVGACLRRAGNIAASGKACGRRLADGSQGERRFSGVGSEREKSVAADVKRRAA